MEQCHTTGRRKTAVARVYLYKGKGTITINGIDLDKYFVPDHRSTIRQPLILTNTQGNFDIKVMVKGGGKTGQAGATMLGIARGLTKLDMKHRQKLQSQGLLTRDSRMVERKKYGQPGARRRFQFSKR